MPTTLADQLVTQQSGRNAKLVALAVQQLAQYWPSIDWESPEAVQAVQQIYYALIERLSATSAAMSARFYDDLRELQGISQEFHAVPADAIARSITDQAVTKAFMGRLDDAYHGHGRETTADLPLDQQVSARLESKIGRHVLQSGRDTITLNAGNDPLKRGVKWARQPMSDDPCGFCVMLASRTWKSGKSGPGLYSSAEAAVRVVGRGGGERGSRAMGEKYHDHCSCEPVPVFGPDDLPDAIEDYRDMYEKAGANAGTYRDPKALLASMRDLYGVR